MRASIEVGSIASILTPANGARVHSGGNMATTFGKQIGMLFDLGALGAMPDRGLLELFAQGGEPSEAAFATLVERHGPMVLRVCRHVLADGHLAEDAFQVTFLLLARRARSIHDPDALAGWLHRVGRRVALRARAGFHRRTLREGPQTGDVEIAVADDDTLERNELCAMVHHEIDRLANAQRLPILLCALEGLSHEEAAQRLGWKLGTVKSRLVRGRRNLQSRLARRGLAPAHTHVPGIDDIRVHAAPVPLVLALATTRAALQLCPGTASTAAAPLSASIALLLQRELTAMFLANLKLAASTAIAAAAAVFVAVSLATPLFGRGQELRRVDAQAKPRNAEASIASRNDRAKARTIDEENAENRGAIRGENQDKRTVARPERRLSPFGKDVTHAMQGGVKFLLSKQQADGSWADVEKDARTGVTSLVVLALLAAGEKTDSAAIQQGLDWLRAFGPEQLRSTYAISLQTMVFAAAEPGKDEARIRRNVEWLEEAQIKLGENPSRPGSWSYAQSKVRQGDNSNSQYALLALHTASEAGIPVKPTVWALSRAYWELSQRRDGSWAYTPESNNPTASMTCAGIASLVISRLSSIPEGEVLRGQSIEQCGTGAVNPSLSRSIDWLAGHFNVDQNFGSGHQWRFYYLNGLERVGRLTGARFFGEHDWYRVGAEELVREQGKQSGAWAGVLVEHDEVLATSFALLFLGKGRAPVLINKLRHGPDGDWNHDPDDVRNLVGTVSRDWNTLVTWQIVDSRKATVLDLLRAPIVFMNGHKTPDLNPAERMNLRAYVEEGGVIFAEACCGSADFDQGFRSLMKEMFPKPEEELRRLPDDHPIWRAGHQLPENAHPPVLGIRRGARTVVIYSPKDLSCYWNLSEQERDNPAVKKAVGVGQDVIDYVTGRTLPPDKLSER